MAKRWSRGAGVAQSVLWWPRSGRSGFDPRYKQRIFPLVFASRPAMGPTQPPVQWVPGVKRGRGVMLTTHPHLVPRLRMSRLYLLSPQAPPWRVAGSPFFTINTTVKVRLSGNSSIGKVALAAYFHRAHYNSPMALAACFCRYLASRGISRAVPKVSKSSTVCVPVFISTVQWTEVYTYTVHTVAIILLPQRVLHPVMVFT
jgi:hypothetical protein